MISIENLRVSYGENTILKSLNLIIPSSSIHGLVGLNGSGKTTLLNTIYGIKEKKDLSSVENEIFSVHQERLDNQIQSLIGKE
jgi:ABC-type multidrug transport system ATPase subunit